jgi:acyl dehydratase
MSHGPDIRGSDPEGFCGRENNILEIENILGSYTGRVDRDAVLSYAAATNDPSAEYLAGAVPPLFIVSLMHSAILDNHRLLTEMLGSSAGGVHAGHDVYFYHPVRADMILHWTTKVYSAAQTSIGVRVVTRIPFYDALDQLVTEHYWSSIYFGTTIAAAVGPRLANHAFPEAARSHELGSASFEIADDQPFRYAEASGDHAPIHLSDEDARSHGFPAKLLHGLCTLAICGVAVVRVAGHGESGRLSRLTAHFAKPVFPPCTLDVRVYDPGAPAENSLAVAFEASSAGSIAVSHGRAEFRTDSGQP